MRRPKSSAWPPARSRTSTWMRPGSSSPHSPDCSTRPRSSSARTASRCATGCRRCRMRSARRPRGPTRRAKARASNSSSERSVVPRGHTGRVPQFSPATQAWLDGAFVAPTPAQVGAWEAVARREHTLVVAPTGSGKTLAAFLSALDRLASEPVPAEPLRRCRVLYVSPLKALAVDVERNLRAPLAGIRQAASRLDLPQPDITVGMRSGDTPADERRLFGRRPPDILITTPESLFLLLTSAARESLRSVDTVIIDEVHAVCATKRGAHLAVSLERLDALLEKPAQRIGLSATVRPVDEVATFLGGGRPVTVVQPPNQKTVDLQVVVPVPDMTEIGETTDDLTGPAAGAQRRASIWPH